MSAPSPAAPQITPASLAHLIESGEPPQIMDVRAPEKVALGSIDQVPKDRFFNTRGSVLLAQTELAATGLDPKPPVVTVCGHGMDAAKVAVHLNSLGAQASALTGGLTAWMNFLLPRPLDPPEGVDRLIQFDRFGKGCLGYLLVSQGEAIIVDPPLQFGAYLEALDESGASLVGVADTHVHADYVSGAVALSQRFGVPYYIHPLDAVYPYDGTPGRIEYHPLSDGSVIEFGATALTTVHTPGHTEGSVSYLVEDRVALTGDFLFVESIGRPDLGGQEEVWAGNLWDSLARAKSEWGAGTAVYPAHYGSPTERRMGQAVGGSFGDLLAENPILQIPDRDAFIRFILENKASFPDAYRRIKALNVGLAPIVQKEVDELEVGRNECALGGV